MAQPPVKRKRTASSNSIRTRAIESRARAAAEADDDGTETPPPPAAYVDELAQNGSTTTTKTAGTTTATTASSKRKRMSMSAGDDMAGVATAADLDAVCHRLRLSAPPKAGLVHPNGYRTNPPPTGRPVRIYADGVFDLFHLGHMRQLQQAKQAFPEVYLIVGVTGDEETLRRKGLTVLSGKDRAETIRHCRWVDEVVEDCPWIIADQPEFIEKHQIDYIAHDDIPYGADEGDDIYAPIKTDGKFLVTQRTEGVSTTGIITKIVRDYELYIMRQLKRGTTRKELNISWLKKNELDIKRAMSELRENIWNNWSTTGQELGRDLRHLLQPLSRPASPGPNRASMSGSTVGLDDVSPATSASGHLLPPQSPSGISRPVSPGPTMIDFASGYALGLVSGVRSWMTRRRPGSTTSRAATPDSDEQEDTHNVGDDDSDESERRVRPHKSRKSTGSNTKPDSIAVATAATTSSSP